MPKSRPDKKYFIATSALLLENPLEIFYFELEHISVISLHAPLFNPYLTRNADKVHAFERKPPDMEARMFPAQRPNLYLGAF